MKNLLGLLIAGGVFIFFATQEDERGVSFFDKVTGKDSVVQNIQKADSVVGEYSGATQGRINAEFNF